MNYLQIEKVIGREILDSRGNPTVETEVTLADGTKDKSKLGANAILAVFIATVRVAVTALDEVDWEGWKKLTEELGNGSVYPKMAAFNVKR